MLEQDVIVTTKYGAMPTFAVCPEGPGQYPGIIFYMDAPGIREELRNMARRIARAGYFCLLPDMYYRLGHLRFDVARRDDSMMPCILAAMASLTNATAFYPHRIKAAASLYGVGIITDKEDSPHLVLDRIKGELYYAFAATDRSVPPHIPGDLKTLL